MRRSSVGLCAWVGLLIVASFGCTSSDPLTPESAVITFELAPENQSGLCCVQTTLREFRVRRISDDERLVVIPNELAGFDLAGVGRCIGEGNVLEFEVRLGTGTWELESFTIDNLQTRTATSATECSLANSCLIGMRNMSEIYPAPPTYTIGPGSVTPVRIRVDAALLATCSTSLPEDELTALLGNAIRFE